MPIDVEIDQERRLVRATGHGVLVEQDVLGFLQAAWVQGSPQLAGFDALIDLTQIETIEYESAEQMQRLAAFAAQSDESHPRGRIAIVASDELAFGLARMYQSYRQVDERSARTLIVVRTRQEAMDWLAQTPDASRDATRGATRDWADDPST